MREKLSDLTFTYDTDADKCWVSERGGKERELTIKGTTNKNGTWYQLHEGGKSHWISFNRDKFKINDWEAFYKRLEKDGHKHYRQVFKDLERGGDHLLIFSFSEFDEWIKDDDGKWKSKYDPKLINENAQPWKNHHGK